MNFSLLDLTLILIKMFDFLVNIIFPYFHFYFLIFVYFYKNKKIIPLKLIYLQKKKNNFLHLFHINNIFLQPIKFSFVILFSKIIYLYFLTPIYFFGSLLVFFIKFVYNNNFYFDNFFFITSVFKYNIMDNFEIFFIFYFILINKQFSLEFYLNLIQQLIFFYD